MLVVHKNFWNEFSELLRFRFNRTPSDDLKVGAAVQSKNGGTDPTRSAGKNIFGRARPLCGFKSTISLFESPVSVDTKSTVLPHILNKLYKTIPFWTACFE